MDTLLAIDPDSAVPRHRQVYDAIRAAILTGRLRSGDRLPATRSLAADLAVSRTTIAEAYDQLQSEGYIFGRHGSGTYVAPDLPEDGLHAPSPAFPAGRHRDRPPSTLRLSEWGRQVVAHPRRGAGSEIAAFPHDFRPHRVAADLFPWDAWKLAVDRALSDDRPRLVAYPPPAGHPGLRETIADHVRRYRGVVSSPEQVVIVSGSQQGLNLLAQLMLAPGDPVAVEDPGYPSARLAFQSRRLRVLRVPIDADGMIVDRLSDAGPLRLVHVTPSHQEPTGATLSLARRIALLDIAERSGCLIVEDDYDSEFRYEGRPVESLQGLDRGGSVIYAGTFSKSILAGLRIGFMILPPHLVAPFIAAKSLWDSGTPMLEQASLAQFIRSGDFERHIRRMRRLYRRRRDAMVTALEDEFGSRVRIGQHHGGLNVLVELDVPIASSDLAKKAAAAGIGLRPADEYYAVAPPRPTLLLGFAALQESDIRDGIRALRACIYT